MEEEGGSGGIAGRHRTGCKWSKRLI
jgi:hypothetical protein